MAISSSAGYTRIGEEQEKLAPRRWYHLRALIVISVLSISLVGLWAYLNENASASCWGHSHHTQRNSQLRVINPPHESIPDPGFNLSLYDESKLLTVISPSLHLSTSKSDKPGLYGVSMFHQLHCLMALRSVITGDSMMEHFNTDHVIHCIDYISQAVVCAADDTIETPSRQSSTGAPIVDGAGFSHYCRDSSSIREMLEASAKTPFHVSELRPGDTVSMLWAKHQGVNSVYSG